VRGAERAVLIWSGPDGETDLAARGAARRLGRLLPASHAERARRLRGVSAASDEEEPEAPVPVRLLVISGDEALVNPDVRDLAREAEHVLAFAMFERQARGLVDLLLPATSYLEREGTYVNLEGRLQRLRPAVVPPAPDELAWIATLGARFEVDIRRTRLPRSRNCRRRSTTVCHSRRSASRLRCLTRRTDRRTGCTEKKPKQAKVSGLKLVIPAALLRPAVERVPELQFQRPAPELELRRTTHAHAGSRTAQRSRRARTERRSACVHASRASSRRERCARPRSTSAASCTTWR
jgi:NADH dehydrogenase/NADH:ubiquinone oxidoreductase subunit G